MKLEMQSWSWLQAPEAFHASCWKRRSQAGSVGTSCSRSVLGEGDSVPCHLTAPGIGAGQLLQVERWEAQQAEAKQDWLASVIASVGCIQLVKMQVELSSRRCLLSVLWSWVNFLQLLQEIRKSSNEREAGGGQRLFTPLRRKCRGKKSGLGEVNSLLSKLKSTNWPNSRMCSLCLLEAGIPRNLSVHHWPPEIS